ncbi:hypothetical protein [Halobacterium noricense]|uniref:hypothetical protein n=1 Tax=Halobacterium noricense TaxID=223182 RepID=UPI001E5D3927|nr:hypothetical protein [Halobacterium noricense]UHH25107.1 hypothetical protein LT974_14155 [Halobacterium noricense]
MSVGWKFSRSSTDEGRSGGNPSEYAFDHDLKDFVRETLQNSNDAGQDISETTEVTYSFRELTGEDLERFLGAIDWDEEHSDPARETLREHIRKVTDADKDATVSRVLKEIEDDGRLLAVTVEDKNTHGLYGPEGGDGPFSALVLDELITEKEGGSGAGGSYGLGKAVLWSWSGLKTVFFNSVPSDTDEEPPRLIGRTQLPAHESDADEYRYEGRGLFGDVDAGSTPTAIASTSGSTIQKWGDGQGRPYSAWDGAASEVAEEMGISRPGDVTGTSVTVLGFCEPGGKSQPSPETLATEVAREASKWFWPAMLRGDLEVTVETADEEIDVEPDTYEEVKPFIRCIQNRNSTRDVLEQPGHVAVQSPTFEIEDKDTEDGEEETESGPINVYARLADPDNSGSLANKVALIRGAGMVVKYYNRNRVVYGDREFHGVVLAGKARRWTDEEPTQADKDIDNYLQAAEPPRHDNWEYTKNLKSTYGTSSRTTIQDLQRDIITDAIKNLVRQTREEGRLVAGRLADRLSLPEGRGEGVDSTNGPGGGGSPVLRGTTEISFDSGDGAWNFSGYAQVREDDYEAWQATCTLQKIDEEGRVQGTIPIDYLECEDEGVYVDDDPDEPVIRCGPDQESIRFSGASDVNPFRGETKIRIVGEVFKGGLRT